VPEGDLLGIFALTWQGALMLGLGGLLMYLGIARDVEPVLLVPIGMGILLANIPLSGLTEEHGMLAILRRIGIDTELFPLLVFIGVGAMIDFGSLLERPYTVFLGAAAQFGIFGTFFLAYLLGDGGFRLFDFTFEDAVAIGIIGSADGPTSIYVATYLGTKYAPAIVVAAYSYMALVPIIQPPGGPSRRNAWPHVWNRLRGIKRFERVVPSAQITAASRELIGQNRNVPRNLDVVRKLMAKDSAERRMHQRRVGAIAGLYRVRRPLMVPFLAGQRTDERNVLHLLGHQRQTVCNLNSLRCRVDRLRRVMGNLRSRMRIKSV